MKSDQYLPRERMWESRWTGATLHPSGYERNLEAKCDDVRRDPESGLGAKSEPSNNGLELTTAR